MLHLFIFVDDLWQRQQEATDGHSTVILVVSCLISLVLGGIIAAAITIVMHRRQTRAS